MSKLITKSDLIWTLPASILAQNGQPISANEIFTDLNALKSFASSSAAYEGQRVSLVTGTIGNYKIKHYTINNSLIQPLINAASCGTIIYTEEENDKKITIFGNADVNNITNKIETNAPIKINNKISPSDLNAVCALKVVGGASIGASVYIGRTLNVAGVTTFSDETNAKSTTTGALTVSGGVGIAKDTYIGGQLNVTGVTTLGSSATIKGTTKIYASDFTVYSDQGSTPKFSVTASNGNTSVKGTLGVSGVATFSNTTDATSTTAAGTVISGGLGVAKQLRVGGATTLNSSLEVKGNTTLGDAKTDKLKVTANTLIENDIEIDGLLTVFLPNLTTSENISIFISDTIGWISGTIQYTNNNWHINSSGGTLTVSDGKLSYNKGTVGSGITGSSIPNNTKIIYENIIYKYISSDSIWRATFAEGSGSVTPDTVVLTKELRAYASIGKVEGNEQDGEFVAKAGDTLQTVFDKIFGSPTDIEPSTNNTNSYSLNIWQNTATSPLTIGSSENEHGTTVKTTTDVILTFELDNTGTAPYGYVTNSGRTTGSRTIYYPIVKQNSADIMITLPTDKTAADVSIYNNSGSIISSSSNILYCNFSSNILKNILKLKLNIPDATVSGDSSVTRFGAVSGSVKLESVPKTAISNDGTTITGYLTYLGETSKENKPSSDNNTKIPLSDKSDAYTVSKGCYYNYIYATNSTTHSSTTQRNENQQFSRSGAASVSATANQYVWFATRSAIKSIHINGVLLSKGTSTNDDYQQVGTNQTIKISTGSSVSGYYLYRSNKPVSAGTWTYDITF